MLFFAGPAQVGQSVTYQITGTISTQAAPRVSKLVLTWTAPTRLYARLVGSGASAAVSVTRAGDGMLSVATPSSSDAADVANLLNQLNFPGTMAGRLNGSDHSETTLTIAPLAPASTSTSSPAAQQTPSPVTVPVNLDLVYSNGSSTLIADGNSNRNGAPDSGFGRRGGGMSGGMGGMGGGWMGGGGRSRGSDQSGEESAPKAPPVGFALAALFDQSGSLQHATFREYFASTTKGGSPIEETFTIDRVTP